MDYERVDDVIPRVFKAKEIYGILEKLFENSGIEFSGDFDDGSIEFKISSDQENSSGFKSCVLL